MGTIEDRKHKDYIEAEEFKKRWEHAGVTRKALMTWITTITVTHLEENILKLKSSGPEEALLPTKLVEVMVF